MRTEFGFARTTCDCEACTHNCEHMPGYLIPDDIPRLYKLSALEGETLIAWARRCLLASPGAIVGDGVREFRIPTLVPARQSSGHCVHLKGGKCLVHEASPFGCAFMDAHLERSEIDRRSLEGLRAIARDWTENGRYSTLWRLLDAYGLRAPGPEESRARMHEAWLKKTKGEG